VKRLRAACLALIMFFFFFCIDGMYAYTPVFTYSEPYLLNDKGQVRKAFPSCPSNAKGLLRRASSPSLRLPSPNPPFPPPFSLLPPDLPTMAAKRIQKNIFSKSNQPSPPTSGQQSPQLGSG
jgi:hypothetical protein